MGRNGLTLAEEAGSREDDVVRLELELERARLALSAQQTQLRLLEAVAAASDAAANSHEALQVAVDLICQETGWPVGNVCIRVEGTGELVPGRIWHMTDPTRFEAFRHHTDSLAAVPQADMPERVFRSGEPAWILDVTADPSFGRSEAAEASGLRGAFAFPVLSGSEVAAVLEFFATDPRKPDEELLKLMTVLGRQLGRVIERERAEEEWRRLSRRTEMLLNSAGEGVYAIDADGITTFVNPAGAKMLGWDLDDLVGRPVRSVLDAGLPDDPAVRLESWSFVAALVDGKVLRADDQVLPRRDGSTFPADYISTPIIDDGEVTGAVVTFNDISERKRFENQLQYLADHDPLTGLYNRRRFEEELAKQLLHTARYGSEAAVMVLDVDNFKYANDTLGHVVGDELIRAVARALRRRLRESDVLARLGGDEFAMLLHEVDTDIAVKLGEDIVEEVRRHASAPAERRVPITASLGISLLSQREISSEELMVEADVAMYEAKEAGRNRAVLYVPGAPRPGSMQAGIPWAERIRAALDDGLFSLWCQPILDLAENRVCMWELLLRMRTPDGRVVAPGAFLPTAERFSLIQAIDRWVIHEALRLLARRRRRGDPPPPPVSINISGKSLADGELIDFIERELALACVDPSSLIFEITETAAIADMDEARIFAERLKAMGCRLALDDFGSGFGTFYYLKYLPLQILKIDGDFIRSLPSSPVDQRMVKALVEVARSLGMQTVAEFVEDEDTLQLLREFGVDFGQGYHIGRPGLAEDMLPLSSPCFEPST